MYLSKVHLNVLNARHLKVLSDCYQMHRLVSCACGSGSHGSRVLFRPELPDGPFVSLLVQSEKEPDWDRPREKLNMDVQAECKPYALPSFGKGQRLRFRLRANPIKTIRGGRENETDSTGDLKRIRIPILNDNLQDQWLERKLQQGGARLDGALAQKEGEVTGNRRNGQAPITLYAVRFDGQLTVQDPYRFASAIRSGVGPAKGFGFGLLSISPL